MSPQDAICWKSKVFIKAIVCKIIYVLTGITISFHQLLNELLVLCTGVRSTTGNDRQVIQPIVPFLFPWQNQVGRTL